MSAFPPRLVARPLHRDRRGSIAVLVALLLPAMIATAALILDGGLWMIERARLQIAADAAANGAGYLLAVASLRQQTATQQQAAFQAVAWSEAEGATDGGKLIGTLASPIGVTVAADFSQVTVTLTATAGSVLARAFGVAPPTLTATATEALKPAAACVLALNPSEDEAIAVDNMGSVRASGCGIFANSSSSEAISLDSGTISGTSVGTVGGIDLSNSGSNVFSPAPGTTGAAPVADPYGAMTPPAAPTSCDFPPGTSFTAWKATPYSFDPANGTNVFCGNTTIGGNGSTDTFAPGIYYVVNGNLTFNNAAITAASGVSFVLTGTSPGGFLWTNYSTTPTQMSAPTSGPTAGILVWQTCGSGGDAADNSMAGGSTLVASGAFYAPCGSLDMSNNAQLVAAAAGGMSVVANTIEVSGSAGIAAAAAAAGGGGTRPRLTQ
jgi:Flp pilus assembly protein TadG